MDASVFKDERKPAILLLGPTGAGKTPLGEQLERSGWQGSRCRHFDFGHHLREAARVGGAYYALTDEEVDVIRCCLRSGALLENETFAIARKILIAFAEARMVSPSDRLVLNGLPRHLDQARMLAGCVRINPVILLECDADTVWERIRRNSGGDRVARHDDDVRAVRKRLDIYRRRTLPLIDYYRDGGATMIRLKVGVWTSAADLVARFGSEYGGGAL